MIDPHGAIPNLTTRVETLERWLAWLAESLASPAEARQLRAALHQARLGVGTRAEDLPDVAPRPGPPGPP